MWIFSWSMSLVRLALRTSQRVQRVFIVTCLPSFALQILSGSCVSIFSRGISSASASESNKCKVFTEIINLISQTGKADEFFLMLPLETGVCLDQLTNEASANGGNRRQSISVSISIIWCDKNLKLNNLLHTNYPGIKTEKIFFVVLCDFKEIVEGLWKREDKDILSQFKWILYNESSFNKNDERVLKDAKSLINFQLNSFLVLIEGGNGSKSKNTYQVYRPTDLSIDVVMESISTNGWWHSRGENERCNLRSNSLRITGVMDEQYKSDTEIILSQAGDGSVEPMFEDGFAVQVLRALQFTMNFKVIVKVTDAWGHIDAKDQEWKGMILNLLKGEADLAISSTADVPFRREVIDFNMPTGSLRLCAYFRRTPSSMHTLALLAPFQGTFWLAILLWLIVMGTVLSLFRRILLRLQHIHSDSRIRVMRKPFTILKLSQFPRDDVWSSSSSKLILINELSTSDMKKECKNKWVVEDSNMMWEAVDCFQWAFGILCFQGSNDIPKYDCFRIVVGVGCLCAVIINGAFAGTLISFLSVATESINSIEQLLGTSYVFSVVNSPISNKILMDSTLGSNHAIYKRRREQPLYDGMNDAKTELLRGSFVYLVDNINAYDSFQNNFSTVESCLIKELQIPNVFQRVGTMTPKNSTFKRIFDYQILRMHEYGLIGVWSSRYVQSRVPCSSNDVTGHQGVELFSVFVAFGAVGLGAVISLIIFIIEKITTYEFKSSKR